jgi:uncharacterized protein (TIGR02231 family)
MAAAMPQRTMAMSLGPGGGGAVWEEAQAEAPPAPEPPPPIEPDDAWLDYDSLTMNGPGGPARGRLRRGRDPFSQPLLSQAQQRIEALAPAPDLRDPCQTRGLFDHRYEADGLAEVPSDGLPHRVALLSAGAPSTVRFRTVPREGMEVYREAELQNPFAAPLLAGPVDVYLEGSLLIQTAIDTIDRGGTLKVGMGVEERIRVARNARCEEESAGVLGGSIAVTHTVTIELASSLPQKALVEVVDRVPVTDDKAVEVRRTAARPEPEVYKQADRGQPVRGGLLWRLPVPPGERAQIEYQYRVVLPAKSEIIGGNRRE